MAREPIVGSSKPWISQCAIWRLENQGVRTAFMTLPLQATLKVSYAHPKLRSVVDILLMEYPQAHPVNKLWRKAPEKQMSVLRLSRRDYRSSAASF